MLRAESLKQGWLGVYVGMTIVYRPNGKLRKGLPTKQRTSYKHVHKQSYATHITCTHITDAHTTCTSHILKHATPHTFQCQLWAGKVL